MFRDRFETLRSVQSLQRLSSLEIEESTALDEFNWYKPFLCSSLTSQVSHLHLTCSHETSHFQHVSLPASHSDPLIHNLRGIVGRPADARPQTPLSVRRTMGGLAGGRDSRMGTARYCRSAGAANPPELAVVGTCPVHEERGTPCSPFGGMGSGGLALELAATRARCWELQAAEALGSEARAEPGRSGRRQEVTTVMMEVVGGGEDGRLRRRGRRGQQGWRGRRGRLMRVLLLLLLLVQPPDALPCASCTSGPGEP